MSAFKPYCYINQRAYLPHIALLSPASRLLLSRLLLITGILILAWVGYPIAKFQLINSREMARQQFLLPGGNQLNSLALANQTNLDPDYTQAHNWFPQATLQTNQAPVTQYTLSIPKLKIDHAVVSLVGEDLSQSLIHYGGTALPGRKGNGVIFGHSVLPQFFNPHSYMEIFSTLHTLKKGDQILVDYDGITYQYQVIDMYQVSPKDIEVLDQTYDAEYLTLITCTPPGTYLRRLIVKAKLVPYQTQL